VISEEKLKERNVKQVILRGGKSGRGRVNKKE
jgi:hypothetical protein